jgi:uncharacterized protein
MGESLVYRGSPWKPHGREPQVGTIDQRQARRLGQKWQNRSNGWRDAMVDIEQIGALGRQIAEQFNPERIILFGSYAYGEPTADSDVDLLVVLPFEGYPFRKASEILRITDPDFAVNLMARTPEQVQQRLDLEDFFIQEIYEQGRVLHEAAHPRVG